jgi:hypothetical protein
VIIVIPKIKKSWGQNILPNKINLALGILNKKSGLPSILTNGSPKKTIK